MPRSQSQRLPSPAIALLLSTLVSGCPGSGDGASRSKAVIVPEGGSANLPLGTPYDSTLGDLWALAGNERCVEATGIVLAGMRSSTLKSELAESYTKVASSLGMGVEGSISVLIAKASLTLKFIHSASDTDLSLSVLTTFSTEAGTALMTGRRLTSLGADTVASGVNSATRRGRCGDEFVDQATLGGRFTVALRLQFADQESKETFYEHLKAKIGFITLIDQETSTSLEQEFAHVAVSVSALQEGGDSAKFQALVAAAPAACGRVSLYDAQSPASDPVVWERSSATASGKPMGDCLGYYQKMIAYARGAFQQDLATAKGRLRPDVLPPGLAVLRYTTRRYDKVGYWQLEPGSDPQDAATAMAAAKNRELAAVALYYDGVIDDLSVLVKRAADVGLTDPAKIAQVTASLGAAVANKSAVLEAAQACDLVTTAGAAAPGCLTKAAQLVGDDCRNLQPVPWLKLDGETKSKCGPS